MKEKINLFSGEISTEDRINEVIMGYELALNIELTDNEKEIFKIAYKCGFKDGGDDTYLGITYNT